MTKNKVNITGKNQKTLDIRYREFIIIFLFAFFSFLIYSTSLNAPFIFDDNHMIVENTFIKNPKFFPMFFKGFVTSYPIPKGMCRPLLMLTFAFNYLNGGLQPLGYHIINILFHFLNATLLYSLLKFLKKEAPTGLLFIITLIFLAHPINTEAVTYISSRSDLMVTFFVVSSFFLYLKNKYIPSLLLYASALLTKETALALPILVFAYYILYQHNDNHHKKLKLTKKTLGFFISLLIVTFIYFWYKDLYFGGISAGRLRPFLSNLLTQSWVTFFYLKLFLWPTNLNFLHSTPVLTSLSQPLSLIVTSGIIILIAGIFILRKNKPILSIGILWYLVFLLPKFYATLKIPAAEHHFYLASIGIYIFLLGVLENIYVKEKKYFLCPAIGVILVYTILVWERNFQLSNPYLVWKTGTEKETKHIGNWINLGLAYKDKGEIDKAKKAFQKALTIFNQDKDWQAGLYQNLAGIYFLEKKYEEAIEMLNQALNLNPKNARAYRIYNDLALVYKELGKEKEAINYWEKALSLNPYAWRVYQNLGKIFIKKQKLKKAKKYVEKAIDINPNDFYSYFLLGKIYEKTGDYERTVEYYKTSISLKPDWFYSHYSLTLVYMQLKNPLFLKELAETIRLNPHFQPALSLAQSVLKSKK